MTIPQDTTTTPTADELLHTWHTWSLRGVLQDAITRNTGVDDAAAEYFTTRLAHEPEVGPLAALAANHELVTLLAGWQWHAIRDALEDGASWQAIAEALHTTPEQARADYHQRIDAADRYAPGLTDTTRYRRADDNAGR